MPSRPVAAGRGPPDVRQQSRYSTLDARHHRLHHLAREAKALLDGGKVESAWGLGEQLATENTALMDNIRALAEAPGLLKSSHS